MAGSFGYVAAASSLPVGSIVQAPYNLTDTNYLPCDGRAVLRATYPKLSACLPSIGAFTATSRTRAGGSVPISSAIATNGTLWASTAPAGTNNIVTTPDGITYTFRATPAACDARSILHDGTNFVAVLGAGGAPLYSTAGVTWTQSVSADATPANTTALQTCMAWSPTLGTVGRFLVANSSGFAYSDNRGVTWTYNAHMVGGAAYNVCWTGTKFIATGSTANVILTSANGITWASQRMPFGTTAAMASNGSIISDGKGKVVWLDANANAGRVFTSIDHGVNWSVRAFAVINPDAASVGATLAFPSGAVVSYTNGRFFITGSSNSLVHTYVSTDLIGWVLLDCGVRELLQSATFSFKAGVYLCNATATSSASLTITEDPSVMRLPYGAQAQGSPPTGAWNNFMPFIKVS